MKKRDIKEGLKVIDTWYIEKGVGVVINVKKTVFTVKFSKEDVKYDYSHAAYLEEVVENREDALFEVLDKEFDNIREAGRELNQDGSDNAYHSFDCEVDAVLRKVVAIIKEHNWDVLA